MMDEETNIHTDKALDEHTEQPDNDTTQVAGTHKHTPQGQQTELHWLGAISARARVMTVLRLCSVPHPLPGCIYILTHSAHLTTSIVAIGENSIRKSENVCIRSKLCPGLSLSPSPCYYLPHFSISFSLPLSPFHQLSQWITFPCLRVCDTFLLLQTSEGGESERKLARC